MIDAGQDEHDGPMTSSCTRPSPLAEERNVAARRALPELWMNAYSTADRLRWFAKRIDPDFERQMITGPVTLEDLAEGFTSLLIRHDRLDDGLIALAREQSRRQADVSQIAQRLGLAIDWEQVATDPARLEDFSQAAARFTRDVLEWEATLPSGLSIPRPELAEIHERLQKPGLRTIALLGEAGCGKSALMATLGKELQEKGEHVIGLRLDQLPREVVRTEQLQEHLELSVPLHEIVGALASARPVVVLIDQLDALCDMLVDHSERLALVLKTIDELTRYEGVRVVVACRPFEFNYDVRLRRTDPEAITMKLPGWSEVEPHVRAATVDPALLGEGLREELRRPQVLYTFLRLIDGDADPLELTTYHAMRQKMWEKHVDAGPRHLRCEVMLFELAAWMVDRGQLDRPLSAMSAYRDELKVLQDAGWITLAGPRQSQVLFRHESLFDFTLARRITAMEESLLDKVLQHQGLWIRRRVWAVLTYLRDEDPAHYRREFDRLWRAARLRQHLRYLLIDFLGQVREVTAFEHLRIQESMLREDLQARAWKAVGGNPQWFSWLRAVELPAQMERLDECSRAFGLLSRATAEYPAEVVMLLRDHWSADVERGRMTLLILEKVFPGIAGATPLMRRIAALLGLRGTSYSIEALILAVREGDPGLAFSLLADAFTADVDRAMALSYEHLREQTAAADRRTGRPPVEASAQGIAAARRNHVQGLIERESVFLGFDLAIEANPDLFLEIIMPPLTRALERIATEPSDPRNFRVALDWPDVGPERQYSLIAQIAEAVCVLARRSADEFADFLARHVASDVSTIHHLLLDGLRYAATQRPDLVVEYFRGDPRRLHVGSPIRRGESTLELLHAVAPALPDACQRELAHIFFTCEAKWTAPASARLRQLLYNDARRHRLALLLTLRRDVLDERTIRRIDEEMRACPDVAVKRKSTPRQRAGFVASPMSAEQMARANDEAIMGLFDELPDTTEWDHPRHPTLGGSIEAARQAVELAKRDPTRGWQLLKQFRPQVHERPAGMIFEALVESGADREAALNWFREAEARGFAGAAFRDSMARALGHLARRKESPGLPDEACARLRGWLAEVGGERQPYRREAMERPENRTLLSDSSLSIGLPNVGHSTLQALFAGLLFREVPAWDDWLASLTEHLERGDDVIVWEWAAAEQLKWVVRADRAKAVDFLVRLYEIYPELMDCGAGLGLISDVQPELDRGLTQGWIEALRQRGDEWHAQAFGELLVLRTLRLADDEWSQREIAGLVTDASTEPLVRAMRCGIARMLAEAMRAGSLDETGFRWLLDLALDGDEDISKCLRDCVWCMMDSPPSEQGEALLRCLSEQPRHLAGGHTYPLLSVLATYVERAPALVADLTQRLLKSTRGKGIEHEELLRVIVLLQRWPGYLERGLDLFEHACAFEMLGTDGLLDEHREVAREAVAPRPRRRTSPGGSRRGRRR